MILPSGRHVRERRRAARKNLLQRETKAHQRDLAWSGQRGEGPGRCCGHINRSQKIIPAALDTAGICALSCPALSRPNYSFFSLFGGTLGAWATQPRFRTKHAIWYHHYKYGTVLRHVKPVRRFFLRPFSRTIAPEPPKGCFNAVEWTICDQGRTRYLFGQVLL